MDRRAHSHKHDYGAALGGGSGHPDVEQSLCEQDCGRRINCASIGANPPHKFRMGEEHGATDHDAYGAVEGRSADRPDRGYQPVDAGLAAECQPNDVEPSSTHQAGNLVRAGGQAVRDLPSSLLEEPLDDCHAERVQFPRRAHQENMPLVLMPGEGRLGTEPRQEHLKAGDTSRDLNEIAQIVLPQAAKQGRCRREEIEEQAFGGVPFDQQGRERVDCRGKVWAKQSLSERFDLVCAGLG